MREIEGFENNYLITEDGDVFNKKTKKQLKPRLNNKGYLIFDLYKNNKRYQKLSHRLVAETYIKNEFNYAVVNHLDFNKINNNVKNLEWCTQKQNIEHSGIISKMNISRMKRVIQINKETKEVVKVFNSIMEVERELGISNSNISECCSGKRKTAGGYTWIKG